MPAAESSSGLFSLRISFGDMVPLGTEGSDPCYYFLGYSDSPGLL